MLVYNILPGGNTVMHKLTSSPETIKKIFMIAHPNEEKVQEKIFEIPFLQNLDEKTALHICKEQQDIRSMDMILTYLAGYGLDHHSRAIVDIIPFMIQKQLPSLMPYLKSRMKQTERLKKIKKGCLKDHSNGIVEISLLFSQEEY